MSEKGKIIRVVFDTDDLQFSSIAGNEENFIVSATEKRFVPGGDDIAVEYTVEEIEGDVKRIKKADFEGGTETDVIASETLTLDGTGGSPFTVGLTTYNTTADTGNTYGHIFDISNKPHFFNGVQSFSETNETVYWILKSVPAGTTNPSNGETIATGSQALTANVWTSITVNEKLAPGRYWFAWTSGANDLRYATGASYPYTSGDVSIIGTYGPTGATTTTWYHFFSYSFSPLVFETSGSWTFPINANAITDVFNSIAQWTETKPAGTDITVYTGLSTSDSVEPGTWVEQTSNGGSIQSISENDDLTGKYLWVKIELETTDTAETPTVSDPLFIVRQMINAKALRLFIEGWAGINKATGDIRIQYNGSAGTLAGDASGHAQVESFDETFTPTGLIPINNPGELEALQAALSDYTITRTFIKLVDGFAPEALKAGLTDYTITRTHVDDLPP